MEAVPIYTDTQRIALEKTNLTNSVALFQSLYKAIQGVETPATLSEIRAKSFNGSIWAPVKKIRKKSLLYKRGALMHSVILKASGSNHSAEIISI